MSDAGPPPPAVGVDEPPAGAGPGDDAAVRAVVPDVGEPPDEVLSVADVRRRTLTGLVSVTARGLGVRGLGLLGNLVLARLLLPRDFGVLAFGYTLMALGGFLSDGGLGASLIRRPEAPRRSELAATLGLQVSTTTLVSVVFTLIALPHGRTAHITALMVWTLVVNSYRLPVAVQLERRLEYGRLARVEVLEALVYTVLSVTLVLLGAGVWGVAAATVVKPAVGIVVLQRMAPIRVLRPQLDLRLVRPLIGFGLAFQASAVLNLVRDQGINLYTASAGGVAVLGIFSLAQRVMLIPFLLFESLWRVSFPAVSRLLQAGEDVRPDLARGLRVGSMLSGLMLVGLAGTAPVLVPVVFGDNWLPAVPVVPLAAAGLLIAGPLSAISTGYFGAIKQFRYVLLAQGATVLSWAVLLPLLLPRFVAHGDGATGNGWAWLVASLSDATVLAVGLRRHAHLSAARQMGRSVLCALLVAPPVYLLSQHASAGLPALVGLGALSVGAYLLLVVVVNRQALHETLHLIHRLRQRAHSSP